MFKYHYFIALALSTYIISGCDDEDSAASQRGLDQSLSQRADMSLNPSPSADAEVSADSGVELDQDTTVDSDADSDVDADVSQERLPTDAYRVVPCIEHVGQEAVGMECAFLTMSQNRVRETPRDIELFIVRPETSPNPDALPVIVLAGGPGASHASFAARRGLPLSMSELLNREVIYYEQRGVAPSQPSTACPQLDSALSERLAFSGCRDDLESEGVDVYSYHTIENAADVSEIAKILGYEQVDLIAGSYGTRLAAHVLSRHPESIRAAVLGGVDVPGAEDRLPGPPQFLGVFERAGELYGQWCAADEVCQLINPGFDLQTVLTRIEALIERDGAVELFGMPVTSVDQIAGFAFQMMYIGQIRNLFFGMLYHAAYESLPVYLMHVGEGDAEAGAAFLARLITTAQEAVFGGSSVMSYVTLCYDGNEAVCEVIGAREEDYPAVEFMELAGSDHPVLFLSGELDPATPAANVELISPLFPNSEHALFECLGHDVSRISNLANGTCVVDKVRAFLDDPSAALPNCEPELCAGMPLVPNQSELVRQLSDYVESFEDLGD